MLEQKGAEVDYNDPHIPTIKPRREHKQFIGKQSTSLETLNSYDMAVILTDHGPIKWTWYTPAKLEQAMNDGQVVVLEFTAEWCLNCKALETTVLHSDGVSSLLAEPWVTPIKIDLTGNNTQGNDMLQAVGRHQIPLLVVIAPNGEEVFKEDFYTIGQVVEAINAARVMTK